MTITKLWKVYSLGILVGCSGLIVTGIYLVEEHEETGSFSNLVAHLINQFPLHHLIMILLIPLTIFIGYLFVKNYKLQEKLSLISFTDELTGLYNRRGFFALADRQLKVANREKRGIFLISSDLDDLKDINDTLGHMEGDAALSATANILKSSFRESDIIARLGGDEFAIMATENPGVTVEILTSRLKANLDSCNAKGEKPYKLSLSIGISHYDPAHPVTIEELLSRADKLMYKDKEQKS